MVKNSEVSTLKLHFFPYGEERKMKFLEFFLFFFAKVFFIITLQ